MIVQVKLWENCNNNCTFCSLKDGRKVIDTTEKLNRLNELIDIAKLKVNEFDTIGLIGGEFFMGELSGIESEWMNTLSIIDSLGYKNIWIATSLICDLNLVIESCKIFKRSNILLCTSYDSLGRFKKSDRDLWINNLDRLFELNIPVNVTFIATQDNLENLVNIPFKCKYININEPFVGLKWYKEVIKNKSEYHNRLISDIKYLKLPKRDSFIKFLRDNPNILKNYSDFNNNHASLLIDLDNSTSVNKEVKLNSETLECGHSLFSQFYLDSCKCSKCDAEKLLSSL